MSVGVDERRTWGWNGVVWVLKIGTGMCADDCVSLLNDPNTSSPANVEASNLYKDNRKEYTKRVRETVEKSWED